MNPAVLEGAGNVFAVATAAELGRAQADVARGLCSARGLDGLLEVRPAGSGGDLGMVIWNADGSRAEACGNGLRCVALFARERGLVETDRMLVETDCGARTVELLRRGEGVVAARAQLGPTRVVDLAASLEWRPGERVEAVLVDVGNPHCVVFVGPEGLSRLDELGPALTWHASFPAGTNVELAVPAATGLPIRARVWERGVGETAACGTGAAAIAVAAEETGRGALPAVVELPGGRLEVERGNDGEVWLSGARQAGTTEHRGVEGMNEIQIAHGLEADEVERRMLELAARHDITMTVTEPGHRGELTRKVPFLGAVEAGYEIRADAVVVQVRKAPGALKNTLHKMLEDELAKALA